MFAYDYPLFELFWTAVWIFLLAAWIVFLFHVIRDIFRSDDLGGVAKAGWLLLVLLLPWLGALIYVTSRGTNMADRDFAEAQAKEEALLAHYRELDSGPSTPDELSKLAALRTQGVITDEEFNARKAKLLA